jgi:hypothetical protein
MNPGVRCGGVAGGENREAKQHFVANAGGAMAPLGNILPQCSNECRLTIVSLIE